jgi:hypothetical protein
MYVDCRSHAGREYRLQVLRRICRAPDDRQRAYTGNVLATGRCMPARILNTQQPNFAQGLDDRAVRTLGAFRDRVSRVGIPMPQYFWVCQFPDWMRPNDPATNIALPSLTGRQGTSVARARAPLSEDSVHKTHKAHPSARLLCTTLTPAAPGTHRMDIELHERPA